MYFKKKALKVIYDEVKRLYKEIYYSLSIRVMLTYNL